MQCLSQVVCRNNDFRVMLLPSDVTKRKVYDQYVVSSQETQDLQDTPVRIFGYREFCRLWYETVPYISVMLPSSDLCFMCQQNTSAIMRSCNLPEEEKSQKLKDAEAHLARAKAERHYYRKQVNESRKTWKAFSDSNDVDSNDVSMESSKANTQPFSMHISFDHAQQVHYPCNPQQPGPAYFKTARKCQIFGVCCEGTNTQVNYLIDETEALGKGANSIVSLVHHYLEN